MNDDVESRDAIGWYLTGVATTFFAAGASHVLADLQLDLVGNLLIELVAERTVDDRYEDVTHDVRHHTGCTDRECILRRD